MSEREDTERTDARTSIAYEIDGLISDMGNWVRRDARAWFADAPYPERYRREDEEREKTRERAVHTAKSIAAGLVKLGESPRAVLVILNHLESDDHTEAGKSWPIVKVDLQESAMRLRLGGAAMRQQARGALPNARIRIDNFQGILGNVQDSTVTQSLTMNVKRGDWQSLDKYLQSLGISREDISDLHAAVLAEPVLAEKHNFGNRVGTWLGKMVGNAASGAWKVGVDVAGALLASAIRAHYGMPPVP
jgi:hypothetical protein